MQNKINLKGIKPVHNWVLLKVKIHNGTFTFSNGLSIVIDGSYNIGRSMSVHCEVIGVPDKLYYNPKDSHLVSHPMDIDMDLQVGDSVIIRYLAIHDALHSPDVRSFVDEESGDTCFFVRYEDIFCARRELTKVEMGIIKPSSYDQKGLNDKNIIFDNGKYYWVIMLNSYLLAEGVQEVIKTNLIVPDSCKKIDKRQCKVVFSGSCARGYYDDPKLCDDPIVKNGATVVVDKDVVGRLLEPEIYASFNGKKTYHIIERRLVQMILN